MICKNILTSYQLENYDNIRFPLRVKITVGCDNCAEEDISYSNKISNLVSYCTFYNRNLECALY